MIGKIFKSNKYGYFKVLEYVGKAESNNIKLYKIQFMKSGCIAVSRYDRILNGEVRDPMYGISYTKIYYSNNYGPFIVLEVIKGQHKVGTKTKIRFINTGTEKIVELFHVLDGTVCDNFATHKTPIDTYILDEDERDFRINKLAKNMWREMKKRCNNPNSQNYNLYGGNGVTYSKDWCDFDTFKNDIKSIFQYEKWYRFPTLYNLDKDYFQQNVPHTERIYSKETCAFLHYLDNINLKSIEYKRNNKTKSKYFGVYVEYNNTFSVNIGINNRNIYLGNYSNEIVAANVFNYYSLKFHHYDIIPLLNDVPYINPKDFILYNNKPKVMCKVINRKENEFIIN